MKLYLIAMAAVFGLVFITGGLFAAVLALGGASAMSAIAWDKGSDGGKYKQLK